MGTGRGLDVPWQLWVVVIVVAVGLAVSPVSSAALYVVALAVFAGLFLGWLAWSRRR